MKTKEEVKAEGKPVFYAILYESMRKAALDCGYALGLHGSMQSDMDLMAMPWTDNAISSDDLAAKLDDCIGHTVWKQDRKYWDKTIKPHGRISYTLAIIGDWHIDLCIMPIRPAPSTAGQKEGEEISDAERELLEATGQWQELEYSLGIKCPQLSVLLTMAKTRIDRLTHEQAIPSPPEKETGKGEERLVSMNDKIQGGAPCVHGTRINVEVLWSMNNAGDSVETLCGLYNLTAEQVRAAIDFGNKYFILSDGDSPAPPQHEEGKEDSNPALEYFKEHYPQVSGFMSKEHPIWYECVIQAIEEYASTRELKLPSEEHYTKAAEEHYSSIWKQDGFKTGALWAISRIQADNKK